MGLDNFIIVEDDALYYRINKELDNIFVMRGLVCSTGNHWIRGKRYNDAVETVTGQSLYQEEIDPKMVKRMSKLISKTKVRDVRDYLLEFGDTEYEKHWKGVQKFFKVAAKYNASIGGWW
jgi:hypothetical protein